MDMQETLAAVAADAARGEMVFSTHGDIALRVRRELNDPACSIDALGKLVAASTAEVQSLISALSD